MSQSVVIGAFGPGAMLQLIAVLLAVIIPAWECAFYLKEIRDELRRGGAIRSKDE